jgi:hypothetical protein
VPLPRSDTVARSACRPTPDRANSIGVKLESEKDAHEYKRPMYPRTMLGLEMDSLLGFNVDDQVVQIAQVDASTDNAP